MERMNYKLKMSLHYIGVYCLLLSCWSCKVAIIARVGWGFTVSYAVNGLRQKRLVNEFLEVKEVDMGPKGLHKSGAEPWFSSAMCVHIIRKGPDDFFLITFTEQKTQW